MKSLINSYDWSFTTLKNRLAPEGTNRLLNLSVFRSPIQLRTGHRLNTLDPQRSVAVKHEPCAGS